MIIINKFKSLAIIETIAGVHEVQVFALGLPDALVHALIDAAVGF